MNKVQIPVFVTVRSDSSRLPSKCLLKFGEGSVIEHVIDRATSHGFKVFVCTTKKLGDDIIEKIALKKKVDVFRGSSQNKMLRWLECAKKFKIIQFHTIDADDPFFCPKEVIRSYKILVSDKLIDIVKPSKSSSKGGATVGFSIRTSSLAKVLKDIPKKTDTEMILGILDTSKKLIQVDLDDSKSYVLSHRLTLDYWEDYILLSTIKCLLKNKDESREEIFKILSKMPELTKINKFRNKDWKEKQLKTTFYREN